MCKMDEERLIVKHSKRIKRLGFGFFPFFAFLFLSLSSNKGMNDVLTVNFSGHPKMNMLIYTTDTFGN